MTWKDHPQPCTLSYGSSTSLKAGKNHGALFQCPPPPHGTLFQGKKYIWSTERKKSRFRSSLSCAMNCYTPDVLSILLKYCCICIVLLHISLSITTFSFHCESCMWQFKFLNLEYWSIGPWKHVSTCKWHDRVCFPTQAKGKVMPVCLVPGCWSHDQRVMLVVLLHGW